MSAKPNRGQQRRRAESPTQSNVISQQLETILNRLTALEQQTTSVERRPTSLQASTLETSSETGVMRRDLCEVPAPTERPLPSPGSTAATREVAEKFLEAITSLTAVRPTQYYVSNFDPNVHDVLSWCDEVEQARLRNKWDDVECLARIAHCLKGDAHVLLSEWPSNDRSWSNFKEELISLCPKHIDVANILFQVMCTNSDDYPTYAEYARRSLLRLKIVRGLSDELLVAIVLRGIKDPQIRATAINSKLQSSKLVDFLSVYIKSDHPFKKPFQRNHNVNVNVKKRPSNDIKCYVCNRWGHVSASCSNKRLKTDNNKTKQQNLSQPSRTNSFQFKSVVCNFCKKIGHKESNCFAKERSNSGNVNFCREVVPDLKNRDVITAVLGGIPTDVLIDTGSYISLISSSLAKHFSCKLHPCIQLLRGFGGVEIKSTTFITLQIEFRDITLEVDFYIVPSTFLNTPVIIGTDVLNRDGVSYIRTANSQRIIRSARIPINIISDCKVDLDLNSVNTSLRENDKISLLNIINKYKQYFLSGTATTTVKTGEMHIRLNSDIPVCYRPYKMSYDEKLRVRNIINDLLDKKIIQKSCSAYASPVLLVKKKDGSDRMVVDYRALNKLTIKERFPLPLINDHIDRLGDGKLFTVCDMTTGFHQIRVSENSIEKTAFVTPEGHYEYLKMPYGLANAPVVYQRIMTETLRAYIESGLVLVYIDDVILKHYDVDEGLKLLDSVLKTLTDAGFTVNIRKCTFLTPEIEYLGRVVGNGQVRPSENKIKALVQSPQPQNVKQVRQFLGLAGYFRRYICGYSYKTACIAALTRKNAKFNWGIQQEKARQEIIKMLTSEPILKIFDPQLETELHTDASSQGYGAVLLQVDHEKCKRVIAYYSRVTVGAEPKYHSYELETLAVVRALQHFRQYLIGKHFKIVTDCNALKLTQNKKDLQPRVARWWIYLQDYDFTLEYRKGTMMSHADYLSRNPVNLCTPVKPKTWAQIAQSADDEIAILLEKLNDGQLDDTRYKKKNDMLYYKYDVKGEQSRLLYYVPKAYRLSLLRVFHDEHQHLSYEKTVNLILKHFWFPGLHSFTKKYILHCVNCLTYKKVPRAPLQPITSWEKPSVPFDTIHVDSLGPLPESDGYKYVLILIDAFTKFCLMFPMRKQDSSELKQIITNAIGIFGTPRLLVCDRGRMFDSADFNSFITGYGIEMHLITPEMHQSNGQVERYCRTVLNMIRVEIKLKSTHWSQVLWKIQLTLNITKQASTCYSALNLLIGTEATTPLINSLIKDITIEGSSPNREAWRELRRQTAETNLNKNRELQDAYVNKYRKTPRRYKVNDLVYVIKQSQRAGKLDSGMRGPYRVTKALANNRYELTLLSNSYGKVTQAAAEYVVPWNGEWTPDACAAFFESCETDSDKGETTAGQSSREDAASSGKAVLTE